MRRPTTIYRYSERYRLEKHTVLPKACMPVLKDGQWVCAHGDREYYGYATHGEAKAKTLPRALTDLKRVLAAVKRLKKPN